MQRSTGEVMTKSRERARSCAARRGVNRGFRLLYGAGASVLFSVTPLQGQERVYADWAPTQAELVPVAQALAAAGSQIARIWPGFWTDDQAALLLSPSGGMVLIASWDAPNEFHKIAQVPETPHQLYMRDGFLPGYERGRYPVTIEINGHQVYALPAMGSTFFGRLEFYVHEAFHHYQRHANGGWVEVPEDSISGVNPAQYLLDPSIVDDPVFRAQLAEEDRLLRLVAFETNLEVLRSLLRAYLTSRAERLAGRPDVEALERRYERREGTAQYVGCRAAQAASDALSQTLQECVARDLERQQPSSLVLRLMQLRPYASGAIMSLALDRLTIESWRDAVAQGWHIDQLLAKALDMPSQ
jgi:hypothetical protein